MFLDKEYIKLCVCIKNYLLMTRYSYFAISNIKYETLGRTSNKAVSYILLYLLYHTIICQINIFYRWLALVKPVLQMLIFNCWLVSTWHSTRSEYTEFETIIIIIKTICKFLVLKAHYSVILYTKLGI